MKNIIILALLIISLSVAVSGQKPAGAAREVCYTIDFVFTGEIQNKVDSLFSLRYTFSAADAGHLRQLVLEDSRRKHSLSLSRSGLQGDMEVRRETDRVKVLVHKYERYDLPVLTWGEDSQGVKHPLRLKTSSGKLLTAEQFKSQLQGIRELMEQNEQIRILETN